MIPVDTYFLNYRLRFLNSWFMNLLKTVFQSEQRAIQEWSRVRVLFNLNLLSRSFWGIYVLIVYNIIAVFLGILDMQVYFFHGRTDGSLGNLFTLLGLSLAFAFYFFGFLQKDALYNFDLEDSDPNVVSYLEPAEGNKTLVVFAIGIGFQFLFLALQKWTTGYSLSLWNIVNIASFVIFLVFPLVLGNGLKSFAKYDAPKVANLILVITGCLSMVTG